VKGATEFRYYIRDPDGYLIEVGQTKQSFLNSETDQRTAQHAAPL
jgi:hypothetical protein